MMSQQQNQPSDGRRLQWIDIVKGLCMACVVIYHIGCPDTYNLILTPFYLTGFFFCAGFTFKESTSWRVFIKKKTLALVVPVVSFGLFNAMLSCLWYGNDFSDRLKGIFLQIPGAYDDMWFVACLFVMEILFKCICSLSSKTYVRACLSAAMMIMAITWINTVDTPLPWHLVNALFFLSFMFMGFFAKEKGLVNKLIAVISRKTFGTLFVLLFISAYLATVFILNNYPVDAHLLRYGSMGAYIISSLFGTVMIVILSIMLELHGSRIFNNAIAYVGKNTLIFYGLQSKFITVVVAAAALLNIQQYGYLSSLVIMAVVIIVLVPTAYLIREYAPFMIGKKYEKRFLHLL